MWGNIWDEDNLQNFECVIQYVFCKGISIFASLRSCFFNFCLNFSFLLFVYMTYIFEFNILLPGKTANDWDSDYDI